MKIFRNVKLSSAIIILAFILNIVLCCQDVIGTYSGNVRADNQSYMMDVYFKDGYVREKITLSSQTAYNVGTYVRINDEDGDKIRAVLHSIDGSYNISSRKREYTRKSVFTIKWGDDELVSSLAIFYQVALVFAYLFGAYNLIFGIKEAKEAEKCENEANTSTMPSAPDEQ